MYDFKVGDIVIPYVGRWSGEKVRIVEIEKQKDSADMITCMGKWTDIGTFLEGETELLLFPNEFFKPVKKERNMNEKRFCIKCNHFTESSEGFFNPKRECIAPENMGDWLSPDNPKYSPWELNKGNNCRYYKEKQ